MPHDNRNPDVDNPPDSQADGVIATFLEAIERGESPQPEEYLARYPQFADDLASFFAGYQHLNRISAASAFSAEFFLDESDRGALRRVGDFELLEEIARGGMGVVFKARQVSLNRIVALKMILAGTFASDAEIKRFLQEAEAAAQLSHPGIVPIYEVGQFDGHHYFTMAFVDGRSLAERLTTGPLAPRDAAGLVRKVANAVQYAHSQGVIHRDLKPSNILMDDQGCPHVSDFGLAKRLQSGSALTGTGQILGTPSYMPPEQATAQTNAIGVWSDVYSLGAILFTALTGRPPFQAATPLDTLLQVQRQDPVSLRSLNEKIPLDLETIVLKCLDKLPARRYASAQQLADELHRFLDHRPILARPINRVQRLSRWCRRNPAIAVLSSMILVTLLASTLISARFAYGEREQSIAANDARDDEQRQRIAALKHADLAKRHTYIAHLNLAQASWENGRLQQTVRLLDLYRPRSNRPLPDPDLRGFEWYYWDGWCHGDLLTLTGHQDDIEDVTYSPDGTRLASASADRTVRIWNASTGRLLRTLQGHSGTVQSVAFSPDGRTIASAGELTARLWDLETGEERGIVRGHTDRVTCVAFSPDGQRIATASWDKTVKIWDVTTGREVQTLAGHTSEVWSVVFSPDGKRLASASSDKTVRIWNANGGPPLFTLKGHSDRVMSVAFHPNGQQLVSGGRDATVIVWDASDGTESVVLKGHVDRVTSVNFSRDGQRIVSTGRDQTVRIWSTESGEELLALRGHTDRVTSASFSPDRRQVASGSWDHTIKIWDADRPQESTTLTGHTDEIHGVAFHPRGQQIASASWDGTVKIWSLATGLVQHSLPAHAGRVSSVAYNHDGNQFATAGADGTLKLWDAQTVTELKSLPLDASSIRAVSFSQDDTRLAAVSDNGRVFLWNLRTLQPHELASASSGGVKAAAFSPDGQQLATSAADGSVSVWDIVRSQVLWKTPAHTGAATGVAFSPDGQWVASCGEDDTIRLFDAATGETIQILIGHADVVNQIAFSPDGTRLVSASDDRTVKLWDTMTGQETLTLNGHTDEVYSVAFSGDGQQIASAGWDKTIKIWTAPRQTLLASPSKPK